MTRASAARGVSNVFTVDLLVGHGVDTTTTSDWLVIPLTGEDLEDLAPMVEDIQVTASVDSWLGLDYNVVLQRRGLNGAWEDVPSGSVLLVTTGTGGLQVSSPWDNRTLGRKFRMVLKVQVRTGSSYGRGAFNISAAIRLFT